MRQSNPMKYTDVSQEQFDQFKRIAKREGCNITGNKDTVELDRIVGLHVEYDKDKREVNFQSHEPYWIAPGSTSGYLHGMMSEAMADTNLQNPEVKTSATNVPAKK